MTHLQHAQPVLLAHHLLAHVHALRPRRRPAARLGRRAAAVARSAPGALAGSSLPLDPDAGRRRARLRRGRSPTPSTRSSDRDFAAEFLFVAALIGVHLSRLGEEIVLWTTQEFGWVELDDAYADRVVDHAAEEEPRRRRAGARQVRPADRQPHRAADTLKGLPLAYNRDLQEDKEPVFDAVDTLLLVLPAFAGHGRDAARRHRAAGGAARRTASRSPPTSPSGWSASGVPFREAHEVAGALVGWCEEHGLRARGARPTTSSPRSHRT